jgi:hypothetical protein
MMAYFYDGGLQPPRPLSMRPEMGMPGRGIMFVGDDGVLVSAFYGGSPWVPDHVLPAPGYQFRGLPGGQLLPESRFKDFKQPEPYLPRCERPDHYADWIRNCKAGKKSIMPIELACDFTEFALIGTATLRRFSTPPKTSTPPPARADSGESGRTDSAVVWIPASNDGHVHAPGARPLHNNGTGAMYWRTSNVLRWDAKAGKFSNDEVANGYVDTPYRKEWGYSI